ncbi:condensation domain-containing protein [Pedosphaera parvula]|uniref:Condensation domain protein n=1 Tax=Pedosphaera parvula (strain Ellin514) TaxID=320771 RepID=B9XAN9_PEDPL|nr:condensation domain-containing protein [Pedosphaera parvula]EEF63074.1 condensation domain protein [Pedosphaera parvula Ellin514]
MLEPDDSAISALIDPQAATLNYPASYSQERLWFVQQLEPQSATYNLPAVSRVRGHIDVPALEQSLNEIIHRHQVLRTSFKLVGNELRQLVAPQINFRVRTIDLQFHAREEREADLQHLVRVEVRQPFLLSHPVLLRATVINMDEGDHVLIIVLHHIAADGWSFGIFSWELETLYASFVANEPSPLRPLRMQFGEYSSWERQEVQSERFRTQLQFWRNQLEGELPAWQIRPDRPRPIRQTFNGATIYMEIPHDLCSPMKTLCHQQRVTPFILLLSIFQVMLHGWSGHTDMVVGTPAINRNREELERLIGFLLNMLVLRVNAHGNPTFWEFLGRVKEIVLSATAHQEVPFEKVLEEMRPQQGSSRNPFVQVVFTFQRGPIHLRLPGLECHPIFVDSNTAKVDLFVEWWEAGKGLQGRIEYNTDLFEAETIRQLASLFPPVLAAAVANPDRQLSELAAMMPARANPPEGRNLNPSPPINRRVDANSHKPLNQEAPALRGSIEKSLTNIWERVLGMEGINRQDNFFELGGHSLLVMQVVVRVRAAFKVNLPMELPFEVPTIAGLAEVIEKMLIAEIDSLGDEDANRML